MTTTDDGKKNNFKCDYNIYNKFTLKTQCLLFDKNKRTGKIT